MFWSRSSESAGGAPQPHAPSHTDPAVETVGSLLRTLGAVDSDSEERAGLEGWAQHAILQTPPPGAPRAAAGRRDWAGLRAYVSRVLENRAARNAKAIGDLRDAVSVVTRSLTRALAEDRASDGRARQELQRLKQAAEERPPEEIKRCALEAVQVLSSVLEERERRYDARLAELSARARSLEGRLEVAEREQHTDALTGLANRRGFDVELARALESWTLFGDRCALVLFDIDHFKKLNDTHGHLVGDAALKAFARALALSFPRRGDCVARYGGEEFAVILRSTGAADAVRLAERCLQSVRAIDLEHDGECIFLTASAGVAEIVGDEDGAAFVARADRALYKAKKGGRDRIVCA